MHPTCVMPLNPLQAMGISRDLRSMKLIRATLEFYTKSETYQKGLLSKESLQAECRALIQLAKEEVPSRYI